MSEKARHAIDEWKQADAAARAAEVRLTAAWNDYHLQKAPAPTAALLAEVARLRQIAQEKLAAAIQFTHSDTKPAKQR